MTKEELQKQKEAAQKNIENIASEKAIETAKKEIAELSEKFEKFATKEEAEKANKELKETTEKLSALSVELKKMKGMNKSEKAEKMTMVDVLRKAFNDNVEKLKSFEHGNVGGGNLVSKALTEDDFGDGGYDLITTDVQPTYASPYAPVWLRNVFPNATTSGSVIKYLRRDTPEGGADIFTRGTDLKKANYKPKYKVEIANIETIAVTSDVPTEMLQDVAFLSNTIPEDMVYSAHGILVRENKMIMDYIKANAVDFSKDAEFDINLEKVLGAGYGQLLNQYMQPTHIIINNWDYLKALAFNKAEGSGEYDSVNFIGGNLYINSLIAVPIPEVDEGTAYVVSARESQFVNRMSPDVRYFEQNADNVETNMVTFRAEERVAFYTKDFESLVKVNFTYPTTTP